MGDIVGAGEMAYGYIPDLMVYILDSMSADCIVRVFAGISGRRIKILQK